MNAPAKVFPPYEIINPDSLKARVRIHANDLRWQCAQFDLIDERHAWKRRDEKKLSEEEKELIRSRAVFPLSHLLERAQAFELEASADSGITLSAEISSFLKDLRSRREALIARPKSPRRGFSPL